MGSIKRIKDISGRLQKMVSSKLILMQLLTEDVGTGFGALIRDANGGAQVNSFKN